MKRSIILRKIVILLRKKKNYNSFNFRNFGSLKKVLKTFAIGSLITIAKGGSTSINSLDVIDNWNCVVYGPDLANNNSTDLYGMTFNSTGCGVLTKINPDTYAISKIGIFNTSSIMRKDCVKDCTQSEIGQFQLLGQKVPNTIEIMDLNNNKTIRFFPSIGDGFYHAYVSFHSQACNKSIYRYEVLETDQYLATDSNNNLVLSGRRKISAPIFPGDTQGNIYSCHINGTSCLSDIKTKSYGVNFEICVNDKAGNDVLIPINLESIVLAGNELNYLVIPNNTYTEIENELKNISINSTSQCYTPMANFLSQTDMNNNPLIRNNNSSIKIEFSNDTFQYLNTVGYQSIYDITEKYGLDINKTFSASNFNFSLITLQNNENSCPILNSTSEIFSRNILNHTQIPFFYNQQPLFYNIPSINGNKTYIYNNTAIFNNNTLSAISNAKEFDIFTFHNLQKIGVKNAKTSLQYDKILISVDGYNAKYGTLNNNTFYGCFYPNTTLTIDQYICLGMDNNGLIPSAGYSDMMDDVEIVSKNSILFLNESSSIKNLQNDILNVVENRDMFYLGNWIKDNVNFTQSRISEEDVKFIELKNFKLLYNFTGSFDSLKFSLPNNNNQYFNCSMTHLNASFFINDTKTNARESINMAKIILLQYLDFYLLNLLPLPILLIFLITEQI